MTKLLSLTIVFDWERTLSEFSFLDIGSGKSYYNENEIAFFEKWYKSEAHEQLTQMVRSEHPTSVYFTGSFLELLVICDEEMVKSLKSAVKKGHIELLGGTYHHTLSSLYSGFHFDLEVGWHQKLIKKTFGTRTSCFFNTENIYYNDLAIQLKSLGYSSVFTGAIDWYLGPEKSRRMFSSGPEKDFKVLLISPNQGNSLFQDNAVENHFVQFDSTQLISAGGWNELVRKTSNKASIVTLDSQTAKDQGEEIYNVRQPISGKYHSIELKQLHEHPLQAGWLKQLYDLAPSIEKKSESIQKTWSSLSSTSHLKKLNPDLNSGDHNACYDTYQILINILSDFRLTL
ncbi:hypothetical protein [Reichenbachiella sp.]|uniref:hypothetical protein n=1 Tax=Reichenbachiella sp. TaxID=2184521 RepID=UPI0032968779